MTKITLVCPICQKEFEKTRRNREAICCSTKCGHKFRAINKTRPSIDRFVEKITINEITGCWEWQGAKNNPGDSYGVFCFGGHGKQVYAHRWSYEYHKGPIPEGLVLDHLCRVRYCVNPDHLEPVTTRTNILRGESPFAKRARQTNCIHGHPFNEQNTYTDSKNLRHCKACNNLKSKVRA